MGIFMLEWPEERGLCVGKFFLSLTVLAFMWA